MSDNNAAIKRKSRVSTADIMMSLLPLIIMITLNTVCTLPAAFIGFYEQIKAGAKNIDPMSIFASEGASFAIMTGLIAYAILSVIIFGLWYKKIFLKKQIKISSKEAFSLKSIGLALGSIIGAWALINLVLTGLSLLMPNLMDQFDRIMESAGLGTNLVTTIIYGCLLGPVAEELMFRGVSFSYLRRSKVRLFWVIFIQAVLFGIAHMNLVQGLYATLYGVVLGLIRHKFGNIRITCLAHIVNNTIAFFIDILFEALNMSDAAYFIIFAALTAIGIFCVVTLSKIPAADIDSGKVQTSQPILNDTMSTVE